MDSRSNPYSPGAGTPPQELAGRGELIERAAVAMDRIRLGRPARSFIFYGLRGVGKTVLLDKIKRDCEARGFAVGWIEAPEGRSLPGILVPVLRSALIQLSLTEAAKEKARYGLRALAGFAKTLKAKFGDIEFGMEIDPELGLADSGDLDLDILQLFQAVGEAAKARATGLVLFIDELQYVPEEQFASLISALHGTSRDQLPITIMAAGLPQLLGQAGRAKSYAERLFEFVPVDRLREDAAADALRIPAAREDVRFQEDAIQEILGQTLGFPYFLQEWGKHSWDIADASPISRGDALAATDLALAELDKSFFRVRFDRLTPSEKRYMRAMAELGPGPHRSGDIADQLRRKVTTIAPVRASLITKGMIYSPSHGDTAFTVPLFDGFMKRIMPQFPT